jgi:membrane protease YdiL (CAAX protease family)
MSTLTSSEVPGRVAVSGNGLPWNTSTLVTAGVLVSRSALFTLAYFGVVAVLRGLSVDHAADAARAWWGVAGVLVNVVSWLVLRAVLRHEGRTPASLIGFDRARLGEDLRTCLWAVPLSLVLAVGANLALSAVMYGLRPPAALMFMTSLPPWALVVTVGVFPLVNAVVEESTYNGLCYPRLEGSMRAPVAIALVTAVFSLQHLALPFAFDLKFLAWRVLSFVPLLLFWVLLARAKRRLVSVIAVHWFMDVFALLTLLVVPVA